MNKVSDEFRRVMGHFPTGVTVVTTRKKDDVRGLTVNAFCSVSLNPPLVLVCIDRLAESHDLIRESRIFAVNFLASEHEDLARRFSQPGLGIARFRDSSFRTEITGCPILDDALAYIDCQVVASHTVGDHTVFIGEVKSLGCRDDSKPLVTYKGLYGTLD